jgi:hypothetical protein
LYLLLFNLTAFFFLKDYLTIPTDFEDSYSPSAVSLLQGKGYTVEGSFNTHHPPLFSLLLALVYGMTGQWDSGNTIYPYLVLVMQTLSLTLLCQIAARVFDARTGVLAAVLTAVCPAFLSLTATHYAWNAMPVYMVFFYLGLHFFLNVLENQKIPDAVAGGICLGLSALAWAGGAYLGIALILYYGFYSRLTLMPLRGTALFCFAAAFLILTLGWSAYAYQNTGKRVYVSSAQTPSMKEGILRFEGSKIRELEFSKDFQREEFGIETPSGIAKFYVRQFVSKPGATLKFIFIKMSRVWYGTDSEERETLTLWTQMPYLISGVFGIAAAFFKKNKGSVLLVCIIAYFMFVGFSTLSLLRYTMPAMGILIIFSAFGILSLARKIFPRSRLVNG